MCLDANTLRSATFVGSKLHSFVLGATVIRFFNCIGTGAKVQGTDTYCYRERKFQEMKVPGSESSRERMFQGANVPGSECSRERKYQGAKGPRGNESSIIHMQSSQVIKNIHPLLCVHFLQVTFTLVFLPQYCAPKMILLSHVLKSKQ